MEYGVQSAGSMRSIPVWALEALSFTSRRTVQLGTGGGSNVCIVLQLAS